MFDLVRGLFKVWQCLVALIEDRNLTVARTTKGSSLLMLSSTVDTHLSVNIICPLHNVNQN